MYPAVADVSRKPRINPRRTGRLVRRPTPDLRERCWSRADTTISHPPGPGSTTPDGYGLTVRYRVQLAAYADTGDLGDIASARLRAGTPPRRPTTATRCSSAERRPPPPRAGRSGLDPARAAGCQLVRRHQRRRRHGHMASDRRQMTYRVVGSRGEALVTNFVGPHLDDRLIIRTRSGEHEERHGARSSYTHQLEAFTRAVRGEASLPIDVDDEVTNMRLIDACTRGRRTARTAADAEDSRIRRQPDRVARSTCPRSLLSKLVDVRVERTPLHKESPGRGRDWSTDGHRRGRRNCPGRTGVDRSRDRPEDAPGIGWRVGCSDSTPTRIVCRKSRHGHGRARRAVLQE
jgi:hypothetical protein